MSLSWLTRAVRSARPRQGFTLIELLVVIVILAILMAIAIPAYLNQQKKAQDAQAQSGLATAFTDARAEAVSNGGAYPTVTSLISEIAASEPYMSVTSGLTQAAATTPLQLVIDNSGADETSSSFFHAYMLSRSGSVWEVTASASGAQTFTDLGAKATVKAVAGGFFFSCALLSNGKVDCWGENDVGQLGNGTTTNSSTPVPVSGISAATAISTNTGGSACALLQDGSIDCWGDNTYGQGGHGTIGGFSDVPVPVSNISTAVAVGVNGNHACALLAGGSVDCWGENTYGQLGDGTTMDSSTPVGVKGVGGVGTLANVSQLAVGGFQNCAVISGAVDCWGEDNYGQLGNGNTTNSSTPVQVEGVGGVGTLANASQVSSGYYQACAVLSGGSVDCWGRNQLGQLGNGNTTNSSTPVQVEGVGGVGTLANVSQVTMDIYFACVVTSSNSTDCWGDNTEGQLGNGNTTNSSTPVQVEGVGGVGTLANVSQLAAGNYHACALISDGSINCWGDNPDGELGNGTTTTSLTPVVVAGL